MRTPTCPKCSQPMDEGFIVDHSHGRNYQAEWVEVPPQKSFWTGVRIDGPTDHRKVATFCCPKCGFLESYAETKAE
jgi:Domain of unknown function (DUF6487)